MIAFKKFISEANRYEKEYAKSVAKNMRAAGIPESEIKKQFMLRQKELTHKMRNDPNNPFLSPKRQAENAVRHYQKTTKGLKGENIAFKDGKPVQYNPTTARQKASQGIKGSKKSLYEPTKITSKSSEFRLTPTSKSARTSIDGTMRALHQAKFPKTMEKISMNPVKDTLLKKHGKPYGPKFTTANIPKGKIPEPPFKMPKLKTSFTKPLVKDIGFTKPLVKSKGFTKGITKSLSKMGTKGRLAALAIGATAAGISALRSRKK